MQEIFGDDFVFIPASFVPAILSWILFFLYSLVGKIRAKRRSSTQTDEKKALENSVKNYKDYYDCAVANCVKFEEACKAIFLMGEIKAFKKILSEKSNGFSFSEAERLTQMTTSLAMTLAKACPNLTFEQAIDHLVKKYAGEWWKTSSK